VTRGAWRPRGQIELFCARVAPPAARGRIVPQTVGVVTLVAHVAHNHFGVVAWLTARAACLALGALPFASYERGGAQWRCQTARVVHEATRAAAELLALFVCRVADHAS
jgi:hypothetical protein